MWNDDDGYDVGGMRHLLRACLQNLREFALEAELEEYGYSIDANELAFLVRFVELVKRGKAQADSEAFS